MLNFAYFHVHPQAEAGNKYKQKLTFFANISLLKQFQIAFKLHSLQTMHGLQAYNVLFSRFFRCINDLCFMNILGWEVSKKWKFIWSNTLRLVQDKYKIPTCYKSFNAPILQTPLSHEIAAKISECGVQLPTEPPNPQPIISAPYFSLPIGWEVSWFSQTIFRFLVKKSNCLKYLKDYSVYLSIYLKNWAS